MSMYAIAFVAHMVGAVALLVGLVLIGISLWRMPRAVSVMQLQKWAGLATKADKLLPFGAALILLSGVYMTMTVWGWSHGWVNTSLGALLLVGALVPTMIGPRLAEIRNAAAGLAEGPVPSALQMALHARALSVSVAVMMTLSAGIAVVMVTKPSLLGSIMIISIALLVGLATAVPARRWKQPAG